MKDSKSEHWRKSNLQVFWGEVAPCEHVVQFYENDTIFLNSLEGFIGSGLLAGDSVIIIATPEHIAAIEDRLKNQGFDMEMLSYSNQYIALDASVMLSLFMVNNWPDENLFNELITSLFKRAHQKNRKVRAFGEMVALLWQQGLNGATVQLESLWNKLHQQKEFTLFCAYPKIGVTEDMHTSMEKICCEHSKIIDGSRRPSTEIFYKTA